MSKNLLKLACLLAVLATPALSAEIRVELRNKGDSGAMVFQPDYIKAAPGDIITFVPVDKGHNVETIKQIWPEGVEPVKSKMSEEFKLTVTTEGVYGIKCTPHVGMGMVALIKVGTPNNLDAAKAYAWKGPAKKRMEPVVEELDD